MCAAIATGYGINMNTDAATNSYVPEINAYAKDGHTKVELGIDMADEDVLQTMSFENGESLPSLTWQPFSGNQSFSGDTAYKGVMSEKLTNNITPNQGNFFSYPNLNSPYSYSRFAGQKCLNNSWFSASYKLKSTGGTKNSLNFVGSLGHVSQGSPMRDHSNNIIKYKNAVDWNSNLTYINAYTDAGTVNLTNGETYVLISSKVTNYLYGYAYFKWDSSNQRFIADGGINPSDKGQSGLPNTVTKDTFNVGDSVLQLGGVQGLSFAGRSVPVDNQWHTISSNAQAVADISIYDFSKNGFAPSFYWSTDGTFYVDDIKFGYASVGNIYRDGMLIHSGYDSDFEDTGATDKAKPNAPANARVSQSANNATLNWDASADNGSVYNYTADSISNHTGIKSNVSVPKAVNIASGIKGYSVTIDNNPNGGVTGNVDTTQNSINKTLDGSGSYAHIASVDNAGNISAVSTTVLDNTAPTITPTYNVPTGWTKEDISVKVNVTDNGTGVKNITLPDGTVVAGSSAIFNVTKEGTYTIKALDNAGNLATLPLTFGGNGNSGIKIDKVAPTLTLSQDNKEWTSGDVIISATATEGTSGMKNIILPDGSIKTNFPAQYTATANGTYTFSATDVAGNVTTQSIVITNIDKVAPKTPMLSGVTVDTQNKWYTADQHINVGTSNEGSASGIKEVQYKVIAKANGNTISNWKTYSTETLISNEGESNVVFRTITNSGALSTEQSVLVKIDKSNPAIKVDDVTLTDSLILGRDYNITTTDAISGVATIILPTGEKLNKSSAHVALTKPGTYVFTVVDNAGRTQDISIVVASEMNANRTTILDNLAHLLDGLAATNSTQPKTVINLAKGELNNANYNVIVNDWKLAPATEDNLGRLQGTIAVTDTQGNILPVAFDKQIAKLIQSTSTAKSRINDHIGDLTANNETLAKDMLNQIDRYILNAELSTDLKNFKKSLATEDETGTVSGTYVITDKSGNSSEADFTVTIPKLIQTVDTAEERLLINIGKVIVTNDSTSDDVLRQIKPSILNDSLEVSIGDFKVAKATEDSLGEVTCNIIVKDKEGKTVTIKFNQSVDKVRQTLETARDRLTEYLGKLVADNDTVGDDLVKQARVFVFNPKLDVKLVEYVKLRATTSDTGKVTGIFIISDRDGNVIQVPCNVPISKLEGFTGTVKSSDEDTKDKGTDNSVIVLPESETKDNGIIKTITDTVSSLANLPKTEDVVKISLLSAFGLAILGVLYFAIRKRKIKHTK